MKITLIFTPVRLKRNCSTLPVQARYMGVMPPLSLAYVAAIAEKAGHEVMIIDAAAENLTLEDIIRRIRMFSPAMLGFTVTTFGLHLTLDWIKMIKDKVGLPVIIGGWHLSIYPYETMQHKAIDYAVIGEADSALPDFLKAYENGSSFYGIKGIAFRDNDKIIVNPPAPPTADLDTVPFPARHLLKNEKYFNILSRVKNFTVMLSARGCPYRCVFCDLNTQKFRMRSAINFVDEIELNYKAFNIREFDIYDSSFTIDKKRTMLICEEILRRKLPVSWTARARPDNVDEDILGIMAKAGCNTIMYGIESAAPRILEALNKQTDIGIIEKAVKMTRRFGIKTLGFFMLGSPGETYETAMETIRFSVRLGLDYVQFTKVTAFPNTELYRKLVVGGFYDYWKEFTLSPGSEKELPMVGTSLTCQKTMMLVRKAYLYFYFRPAHILNALKRMHSPMELKNNILAAAGLIFNR